MPKQRCLWVCLCVLAVARPVGAAPADAGEVKDARGLAAAIDHYVEAGWAAAGVKPAERADDAEFLRRVYLDLAGKIPPVSEVREFLADPSADKRERLVEKLLD